MIKTLPTKDPDDTEPYFIVWCDKSTGINDGSQKDNGELQGATIVSAVWTLPPGIVEEDSNQDAITIAGINYAANTVCTIWLSGGTAKTNYTLECQIVTSDGRLLTRSIIVPVGEA